MLTAQIGQGQQKDNEMTPRRRFEGDEQAGIV